MNLSRTIALYTLGLLAVAFGGWFLLNGFVADSASDSVRFYPIIPIIFYAFGVASIIAVSKCKKEEGRKTANVYMLLKLIKLVITMVTMLLAFFLIKEAQVFVLVFAIYYALYIVFETIFIFRIEKRQKNAA